MKIELSRHAKAKVKRLIKEHGTYDISVLVGLTGYPRFAIQDFVRELVDKDAAREQAAREKRQRREAERQEAERKRNNALADMEPEKMPQFVHDCQNHTGLKAIFVRKAGNISEWLLLAPAGVPIIRIVGVSDLLQGVTACPPSSIQGLTQLQVRERRKKRMRGMDRDEGN